MLLLEQFSVPPTPANHRREEPTPIPTTSTLAGVAILTPSSDGSLVAVTLCEACLKAAPLRSYAHPPPQPASPCDSFTHPITNSPTMPASCPHPKFKPVLQIARDANLPRALPRVPCRPLPTVSSLSGCSREVSTTEASRLWAPRARPEDVGNSALSSSTSFRRL